MDPKKPNTPTNTDAELEAANRRHLARVRNRYGKYLGCAHPNADPKVEDRVIGGFRYLDYCYKRNSPRGD